MTYFLRILGGPLREGASTRSRRQFFVQKGTRKPETLKPKFRKAPETPKFHLRNPEVPELENLKNTQRLGSGFFFVHFSVCQVLTSGICFLGCGFRVYGFWEETSSE